LNGVARGGIASAANSTKIYVRTLENLENYSFEIKLF